MTSVTTGSPVSRLASARYLSPSSSSPWKEYGDVRGLKAPPRKTRAPAALTFAATSSTCPRDSTEHGPAITTISYAVFCLKKKKKQKKQPHDRAHSPTDNVHHTPTPHPPLAQLLHNSR